MAAKYFVKSNRTDGIFGRRRRKPGARMKRLALLVVDCWRRPWPSRVRHAERDQAERTQPGPSYKDLKFPPLRPIQIPKIEKATLPNGMRIYLLEDHELPIVHGTALVRTGNLFDPPDKVGLAGIDRPGDAHRRHEIQDRRTRSTSSWRTWRRIVESADRRNIGIGVVFRR